MLRGTSFIVSSSKVINAAHHTLLPVRGSNPRLQDTKPPENSASQLPPRSSEKPSSNLVNSICSLFKPGQAAWDPAIEVFLKPLCARGGLTPLQAMDVIIRLKNPLVALDFLKLTKTQLNLNHLCNTYILLISKLRQAGLFEAAKETLEDMKNSGHFPTLQAFMDLVTCQARAGKIDEALELFKRAKDFDVKPPVGWYNTILNILVQKNNNIDKALGFFRGHLCQNIRPDVYSFNIIMKGLCKAGHVDEGFSLLQSMVAYECIPDVVSFNTIISGFCRVRRVEDGYRVLKEMQGLKKCKPDVVSYTSVILGFCKMGMMDGASRVLNEMVDMGESPNLMSYNILLDGFCKEGTIDEACSLFKKMVERDVVSYTTMIDGYCKAGQTNESMKLLDEMNARGLVPNVYTYAAMINGLCKANRLSEALVLLEQMRGNGVGGRTFIYNPVIDGICKTGNVDQANLIFKEMRDSGCAPDKITYTILIYGHCMKGRMSEAISLFHEMLQVGCDPDKVIVLALVSCLLKASMPNEAKSIVLSLLDKGYILDLSCSSVIHDLFKEGKAHETDQVKKAFLDRRSASTTGSQIDH